MENNEDKFEKIYQELYESQNEILNTAKKEKNKNISIVFVICIVVNVFIYLVAKESLILPISLLISIFIVLFVIHKVNLKYIRVFKENIVQELVKKCNEKLVFNHKSGIMLSEYRQSNFDNSFDEYFSEDLVQGYINKNLYFRMSQIVTKVISKYKDSDGTTRTTKTETFRGLYGIVKMNKSIHKKIYVTSNSFTKKYSSQRVEMDSAEFEKDFDCLTGDRITSMKIFTADVLEKFVDLKRVKLNRILLKIEGNYIYFRINCGEIFEPPKIKDPLDKEIIRKYYNAIFIPTEIIVKIFENINTL